MRLRDHVGRVGLVLVVLGHLRPDLLRGELAGELAQALLLLGEGERDARADALLDDRHCLLLPDRLTGQSRELNRFLTCPGYAGPLRWVYERRTSSPRRSRPRASSSPLADAGPTARPPVVWLKGEGNFTKSHRPPRSIDQIVVHVTEGAFWGSVQWLKNPRAHASSHYVIARSGKIVQLVHLSDIAWHAGNWKVNTASVGIEHEGFTYGPGGFTDAQYHASARLTGVDRTSLADADRPRTRHRPRGGARARRRPRRREPPHRSRARTGTGAATCGSSAATPARVQKLSVTPLVPRWAAARGRPVAREGDRRHPPGRVLVDGRVVSVDRRAPVRVRRRLNTTRLANGRHVLQVHGVAGPGRYDIARRTIVVDNRAFALTSAGARPWTRVRGPVRLRVRPWGAKAASMTFRVDGRRRAVDRRAPFVFAWNTKRAKPGKHVLEVVATSVDGRVARRRIPIVVAAARRASRSRRPRRRCGSSARASADGQEVTGLVVWRVDVGGKAARVEFLVDGTPARHGRRRAVHARLEHGAPSRPARTG